MLATNAAPFSRQGWIFELKYDGYRVLASKDQLLTRNKKDARTWYPEVTAALSKLRGTFVLDGEVCIVDERGVPDFERMRARTVRRSGELVNYYAFDLPFLNGRDPRGLPLIERKQRLRKLIPTNHLQVGYVDHIETDGELLYRHAAQLGMEGVIGKKADSLYSREWLKAKPAGTHDGWERPRRSRK